MCDFIEKTFIEQNGYNNFFPINFWKHKMNEPWIWELSEKSREFYPEEKENSYIDDLVFRIYGRYYTPLPVPIPATVDNNKKLSQQKTKWKCEGF